MQARRQTGFTLLEIMIVVVLISLLAGLTSVRLLGRMRKSKTTIAEATVNGMLKSALQQFYLDNDFYPTTAQGLQALVEKPTVGPEPPDYDAEGYVENLPLDPWGMPYQYECPGKYNAARFDLWSMGPDRKSGTDDDIVNWRKR